MLNRIVSVNGPVPGPSNFKDFLFLRPGLCNETNSCATSYAFGTVACSPVHIGVLTFLSLFGGSEAITSSGHPCFCPDHQVMRRESRRHVGGACPVREQYLRERNIPIIVLIVNGLGKHIFQCPIYSVSLPSRHPEDGMES